jgi:predicted phage terminase large subunit-like protein
VGDTALKAGATSDFSVFTLWITSGNDLYLVDMIRGKWDYPQLRARLRDFVENNLYCDACYLEDFGTGTVLLKDLPTDIKAVRFRAVDRSSRRSSKAMRAQESKSYLEHISVHLPIESESIRRKFLKEVCGFSLDMDHANDDICDTFFDAARILGETVRRKIRPSNPEIEVKLIQKIEQGYASSRSIGGRF